MRLDELINDPDAGIDVIATLLDGLDGQARWNQVRRLGRDQQRRLYGKATPATVDLTFLVGDAPALTEVLHDGVNTLPVAPPLRRFQKRFCRPDSETGHLYGYNEGPLRRLIGPGYFVAATTADAPDWQPLGGVVVDYFQPPSSAVAAGWPKVVPNNQGLQRFVYHETRDFLRRVSAHVSIGAAYKRDTPLDHYFVLCRRH